MLPVKRRTVLGIAALLSVGLIGVLVLYFGTRDRLSLWEGPLDVSPIERAALEACGRGRVTVSGSQHLMRAPYLQNVGRDHATLVFAALPNPAFQVRVWLPGGKAVTTSRARYADEATREAATRRRLQALGSQETVPASDFYLQRADLTSLEPGTLYCYQLLGPGGAQMDPAPLATAPEPGTDTAIDFVALGDSGTGNAAARAIAKRLAEVPFEFMLFLGDIAYSNGTADELDSNFFQLYDGYLRYVPAFTALGNHEYNTENGRYYLRDFVLPGNEHYYSFDWGDAHFTVLDTTHLDPSQVKWLEQDLRATHAEWRIVIGHHPPFSNSRRGSNQRVQHLVPTFERYGVDLVLSGHEHHYERFATRHGIHFIVSGGGGGRLTTVAKSSQAVVQAQRHHFLAVHIEGDHLEVRAIDVEGQEFDHFELHHDRERTVSRQSNADESTVSNPNQATERGATPIELQLNGGAQLGPADAAPPSP